MKLKRYTLFVIISSLLGYLQWGQNNSSFLYEAEAELIKKSWTNPLTALHPFILLPVLGQIVLIVSLFQKIPSKVLLITGTLGLALLLTFMLIIGIFSQNLYISLSTLPFMICATLLLIELKKRAKS